MSGTDDRGWRAGTAAGGRRGGLRRALRAATMLAMLAAGTAAAAAQEWRGEGEGDAARAFFARGGRPAGIELRCEGGGRIRVTVAGNGARFPAGRDFTLVLSVDGTARILAARAEGEPGDGGSRFVAREGAAAFGPVLEALAGGTALEISAPSGAVTIPLKGSGRAVARLRSGCAAG